MTTHDLTPIAGCSLGGDAAPEREAQLRDLLTPALRRVERSGPTAVLDLAMGTRAERALADLLRRERECCPFWEFVIVRRSPRRLTLTVRAGEPHAGALDALLASAGAQACQEPAVRAGEAARRAGVGIETLRFYERRGLLPKPRRTPSGQREYTLDDIRLVRAVKAAQRLGFTLAETREIVRLTRPGGSRRDPQALRAQAEAKLAEVDDKIRGLRLMREELRAVIAAGCDTLIGCGCGDCPIDADAVPGTRRPLEVIR